ncbi:hypothetical protein [Anabaena sp. CCY 0017]
MTAQSPAFPTTTPRDRIGIPMKITPLLGLWVWEWGVRSALQQR